MRADEPTRAGTITVRVEWRNPVKGLFRVVARDEEGNVLTLRRVRHPREGAAKLGVTAGVPHPPEYQARYPDGYNVRWGAPDLRRR